MKHSIRRLPGFFPPVFKRSILGGLFNYNEAFPSFVKDTHQKQDTASIMGIFAGQLRERDVCLPKQDPIRVADLGCANGNTGLQYIRQMHHEPGVHYYGFDNNEKFLGEAEKNLAAEPLIKKHFLVYGDALGGNLKKTPECSSTLFDFVFVSHTAYYLKDQPSCRAFLVDTIKLLAECGIAVFLHEDSTYYFRSTYNENNFGGMSAPMLLEHSAQGLKTNFNQFKSIKFTSKLTFSEFHPDIWEAMKDPEKYQRYAHLPNFIETLEKLAFIVQRDLIGMVEEGRLSRYIDEIREAVAANNHCLDLETTMQILLAPECKFRHNIAVALSKTLEAIPTALLRKNETHSPQLKF